MPKRMPCSRGSRRNRILGIQVLAHLGDPAIADHEDPAVVVVVRGAFALRAVTCHSSAIVSPSAIIAPNSNRWRPASMSAGGLALTLKAIDVGAGVPFWLHLCTTCIRLA